jgi:hypothetical protein
MTHLALWIEGVDSARNTRNKSSSSNRDDDCINFRHVLNHFHSNCSSTSTNRRIVASIDAGEAFLLDKSLREFFRLSDVGPMDDDASTEFPFMWDETKLAWQRTSQTPKMSK